MVFAQMVFACALMDSVVLLVQSAFAAPMDATATANALEDVVNATGDSTDETAL